MPKSDPRADGLRLDEPTEAYGPVERPAIETASYAIYAAAIGAVLLLAAWWAGLVP